MESKDGIGVIILGAAVYSGYEAVVKLLLEKGVNRESKSNTS